MVVEISLSACETSDIDIFSDRKLFDVECADDVVLLSEDQNQLQAYVDRLQNSLDRLKMLYSLSKCKMRL